MQRQSIEDESKLCQTLHILLTKRPYPKRDAWTATTSHTTWIQMPDTMLQMMKLSGHMRSMQRRSVPTRSIPTHRVPICSLGQGFVSVCYHHSFIWPIWSLTFHSIQFSQRLPTLTSQFWWPAFSGGNRMKIDQKVSSHFDNVRFPIDFEPKLSVHGVEKNLPRNYKKVHQEARGEWCWL